MKKRIENANITDGKLKHNINSEKYILMGLVFSDLNVRFCPHIKGLNGKEVNGLIAQYSSVHHSLD